MPYFGKTKYALVDQRGPCSVSVFHFTTAELLAVALDVPSIPGYIVGHNGKLYQAPGKVALAQLIEHLPESQGFTMDEQALIALIVKEAGMT